MTDATPRARGYFMPAEWEPHDAVWLAWPHDRATFGDGLPEVERTYASLIYEIHETETVHLFVLDADARRRVAALLQESGVDTARVRFHERGYADVWLRDCGPTFVVRRPEPGLAMVHWIFNAWGGKYEELKKDASLPLTIQKELGVPRFEPGVVLEGGSIEVNGRGTLLTTRQCLLHPNRNPRLDRAGIESVLGENLGVSRVLWLNEGVAGDDTDGHIDDIARFTAPDTVVCAVEDDPKDANYAALRENFELLRLSRDQDGRPLKVLRLPMPAAVTDAGGRLPASYANFYIGNGVVLVPAFGCPQDAAALEVLSKAFPGRRLAPIPCRALVRGLGTLHCVSQQQPRPYF